MRDFLKTTQCRTQVTIFRNNDLKKFKVEELPSICAELRPGAIILLHDRLPQSAERLQMVIEAVKDKGYEVGRLEI